MNGVIQPCEDFSRSAEIRFETNMPGGAHVAFVNAKKNNVVFLITVIRTGEMYNAL